MIKEESSRFSIGLMCHLLSVSTSGYYNWRSRKPSRRDEENRQLANKIKAIFDCVFRSERTANSVSLEQ